MSIRGAVITMDPEVSSMRSGFSVTVLAPTVRVIEVSEVIEMSRSAVIDWVPWIVIVWFPASMVSSSLPCFSVVVRDGSFPLNFSPISLVSVLRTTTSWSFSACMRISRSPSCPRT